MKKKKKKTQKKKKKQPCFSIEQSCFHKYFCNIGFNIFMSIGFGT